MPKLVLDASLIISWCVELNDPVIFDHLLDAGFEPLIPDGVAEEIETRNDLTEHVFENSEIIESDETRREELTNRFFRLGSGEITVLVVGEELQKSDEEYICILDDRIARQAADKIDLEYTGTVGLLGILIGKDMLEFERADELIQEMKDFGTWLPENHTELLRETAEKDSESG